MSLIIPEEFEIKNDILNNMKTDVSKIEGSYSYDIASANGNAVYGVYEYLKFLFPQLFPFFATDDVYLDEHMEFFGLTRRGATQATGEVEFTGTQGSTVPKDSIVISRVGEKYKLLESVLLEAGGVGTGLVECVDAGTVGNCGIGDIVTSEIVIPGVFSLTNKVAFTNGFERETVESCWNRMKLKASRPSHSGNKNEYENWSKEVQGVGRVLVIGSGEEIEAGGAKVPKAGVNVYISDYDLKPVQQTLLTEVKNYIEDDRRPVGANVTVLSLVEKIINVSVETKLTPGTNISKVKTDFTNVLNLNFKKEEFTQDGIVSVGKIGRLLFDIPGVIDYRNLTLNGGTASIVLKKIETANLGTVGVTQWT